MLSAPQSVGHGIDGAEEVVEVDEILGPLLVFGRDVRLLVVGTGVGLLGVGSDAGLLVVATVVVTLRLVVDAIVVLDVFALLLVAVAAGVELDESHESQLLPTGQQHFPPLGSV